MTNSNKGQSTAKKPSFIILVMNKLVFMIFIFLLSFIFLVIWFESLAVVKGDQYSINKLDQLSNFDNKFIQMKLSTKFKNTSNFLQNIMTKLGNAYSYFLSKINNNNFKIVIQNGMNKFINYLFIIYKAIIITINRLVIFILNLPFFLATVFVASIDGLGQRDIRKFKGARESTLLFHKVKPLIGVVYFTSLFTYLAFPLSIQPWLIMIPMTVMASFLVMISITNFKKYA